MEVHAFTIQQAFEFMCMWYFVYDIKLLTFKRVTTVWLAFLLSEYFFWSAKESFQSAFAESRQLIRSLPSMMTPAMPMKLISSMIAFQCYMLSNFPPFPPWRYNSSPKLFNLGVITLSVLVKTILCVTSPQVFPPL